jgi:DNA-directed RNA polymerase subunit M/transcription elongation factor TFIIS
MDGYQESLKKYFGKQKNIDYILNKTKGEEQAFKIFEILCFINNPENKNANKLEEVIFRLKNDQLLWPHATFDFERLIEKEMDDFITHPPELAEGVLTCCKCGSKKIYSMLKQTRSLDEPMTVFASCSECRYKWTEGS